MDLDCLAITLSKEEKVNLHALETNPDHQTFNGKYWIQPAPQEN